MATYAQRNGSTRAQVRMRGQEASATFDTRIEAEQWAEPIEARIKRGEIIRHDEFGENPKLAALIDKYIKEVSPHKGAYQYERITGTKLMGTEWNKVLEGVYTGFSIGGKYGKTWDDQGHRRYEAIPAGGSLVD
ncbi:hypothetical protein [Burkholderia ubonensis]|nr:hypothetical protein [Burkholderia ubonensis]